MNLKLHTYMYKCIICIYPYMSERERERERETERERERERGRIIGSIVMWPQRENKRRLSTRNGGSHPEYQEWARFSVGQLRYYRDPSAAPKKASLGSCNSASTIAGSAPHVHCVKCTEAL